MSSSGRLPSGESGAATDVGQAKAELLRLLADGAAQGVDWYSAANDRFVSLIGTIAVADHLWMLRCIAWLRSTENLAPAAIVAAVETVRASLSTGTGAGVNRKVIALVLRRAYEPGDMLKFCLDRYGSPIPKPIQRGIADAAKRLYDEESALKFDTPGREPRFGDVLSVTHPKPGSHKQAEFFRYLLERRTSVTPPTPVSKEPVTDGALAGILAEAARTGRVPF